MTTPHPAFMTTHPPGRDSFAGHLMLRIAAGASDVHSLQREVVDLVTSGEAGRRFHDAVDDPDEALLLLHDLLREHDSAVGERTEHYDAFTIAGDELLSDHAVITATSNMDRGGAHGVGQVLLEAIPHCIGYVTVEEEALESAVLTGRLLLGVGAAGGLGDMVAGSGNLGRSSDATRLHEECLRTVSQTAVEVFRAHGLAARIDVSGANRTSGADRAYSTSPVIVLEDISLAHRRGDEESVAVTHMRGPRHEVIPQADVTAETFLALLERAECHEDSQVSTHGQLPPVRVWDGFDWLLEVAPDTVCFRHLRSDREHVTHRGTDEEIVDLVTALLSGDVRSLRTVLTRDRDGIRRCRTPSPRSLCAPTSASAPPSGPIASRHPAFGTVYPPDRSTFAGSLMLMVASAVNRTYDDLQVESVARAEEAGVLTPEEVLLLLDDIIDLHDATVGSLVIDHLHMDRSFATTEQRGLVMGVPQVGLPSAREVAFAALQDVSGSIGCVWADRHDFEEAVLTRSLGLTVAGSGGHADLLETAVAEAEQHFRDHGWNVRSVGTAATDGRGACDRGTRQEESASVRLIVEPLDWALTHDVDEVRGRRILCGPRDRPAVEGECVTAAAVLDAVRTADGSQRGASSAVEVWTGRGWQLDIERDVLRLTHRRSPRVHVCARPVDETLRTFVERLLEGEIAGLLAHDWEITTPGVLERRRPGHRGPNMRMHPVAALPYTQEESTFIGMTVRDVARGILYASDLRRNAASMLLDDLLDDSAEGPDGLAPHILGGVLMVDEIVEAHNRAVEDSVSSVPAFEAAISALEDTGIVVALGAADLADGHCAGREFARLSEEQEPHTRVRGYAFCHDQDLDRAVHAGELYVGFGALPEGASAGGDRHESPDPAADEAIAAEVVTALRDVGLAVNWDGSAHTRILVSPVAWASPCRDLGNDGTPVLRGRWGNDYYGAAEVTTEELSRAIDEVGEPFEEERNVVELGVGSGWTLEVDPEHVWFGHLDAPVQVCSPRPDSPALIALAQDLLDGDFRAILARDWERTVSAPEASADTVTASSGSPDSGSPDFGVALPASHSLTLTDRWGAQVRAPGDLGTVLALFDRFYGDLDDGDDREHTVVVVESSDGWYLEFSSDVVSFGHVEDAEHDLDMSVGDAEIAASLVQVFVTEGPAAVADSVRAGPPGRR